MTTIDLFQRLALALAIGLLFGIERGWQERERKPGARAAGIRTFALIGLLGGVWGLLVPLAGAVTLGFASLGFAIGFTLFEWRETRAAGGFSATGLVAGLLAFALGAYAVLGNPVAAGSAAVAATFILAERRALHTFLERMSWKELRAALLLLVMSFVLLPLLPDRTVDPWAAINPHQIWLMTIIIAALSYGGYIAVRLAGGRRGLLFAGAAGGLVSSTTVTWTFARLLRQHPEARTSFLAGILASWAMALLRVVVVAGVFSLPLGMQLGKIIGIPLVLLAAATALFYRRSDGADVETGLKLSDPFELGVILRFSLVLTVILFAAKVAASSFGEAGVLALAATTGAADIDPILLSMAQATAHGAPVVEAALAVLVAIVANTLAKSVLAFLFGGPRVGTPIATVALVAIASGAALFVAVR